MKFTVDLEEFWLDGEEDLLPALQEYVTREVTAKISKSIEQKVEKQIFEKVELLANAHIANVIDTEVDKFVGTGMITPKYKKEPIPVSEYLEETFNGNTGWNSPAKQLEEFAKRLGKEMKARYDLVFATHIVSNMKEQGLLKDEVAQMLLEQKA